MKEDFTTYFLEQFLLIKNYLENTCKTSEIHVFSLGGLSVKDTE